MSKKKEVLIIDEDTIDKYPVNDCNVKEFSFTKSQTKNCIIIFKSLSYKIFNNIFNVFSNFNYVFCIKFYENKIVFSTAKKIEEEDIKLIKYEIFSKDMEEYYFDINKINDKDNGCHTIFIEQEHIVKNLKLKDGYVLGIKIMDNCKDINFEFEHKTKNTKSFVNISLFDGFGYDVEDCQIVESNYNNYCAIDVKHFRELIDTITSETFDIVFNENDISFNFEKINGNKKYIQKTIVSENMFLTKIFRNNDKGLKVCKLNHKKMNILKKLQFNLINIYSSEDKPFVLRTKMDIGWITIVLN